MLVNYAEVREKHLLPFTAKLKQVYAKPQKTVIIAHNDSDGITSAIIFSKILDSFGLKYKKDYSVYFGDNELRKAELPETHELIKEIKSSAVVIYLDYRTVHAQNTGKKVFIVDHHNKSNLTGYKDATWYYPLNGEIYRPSASAFCYDIYKELLGQNHDVKLMATIGAVGDSMLPNSLDYLDIKELEQPFFVGRQISWYFFNAQRIFCLAGDNKSCLEIYNLLLEKLENKTLNDLTALPESIESRIYKQLRKDNDVVSRFKGRLETYEDLKVMFLEMTPAEAGSKDAIFGYVWLYYPGYLCVIHINFKGIASLSMRSNTYDILDVFEKVQNKLPELNFGGHPFAAGGKIENSKVPLLKDLIIAELKTGKIKSIN
ncbi:MAG: DHH family phosphoesterase [Candidatus ainarchaeum sp.]|nr:DHH family phosphoesterase [Candidatus ainarchaeum sp.]